MTETSLIEKLRELGDHRQKVGQQPEQLAQQATFLDGQLALLVDLLGGPERVKALLEQPQPTE